jgi:hypothetical protein
VRPEIRNFFTHHQEKRHGSWSANGRTVSDIQQHAKYLPLDPLRSDRFLEFFDSDRLFTTIMMVHTELDVMIFCIIFLSVFPCILFYVGDPFGEHVFRRNNRENSSFI